MPACACVKPPSSSIDGACVDDLGHQAATYSPARVSSPPSYPSPAFRATVSSPLDSSLSPDLSAMFDKGFLKSPRAVARSPRPKRRAKVLQVCDVHTHPYANDMAGCLLATKHGRLPFTCLCAMSYLCICFRASFCFLCFWCLHASCPHMYSISPLVPVCSLRSACTNCASLYNSLAALLGHMSSCISCWCTMRIWVQC